MRTNPSGNHLYVREDASTGGDGSIDEYDVSGAGQPTLTNNYAGRSPENSQDFLVDEPAGKVFTLEYPGPGFGVTNMKTNTMTSWYFGNPSYGGQALAALPSGPLYRTSSTYIYEFNASGRIIAQYADPDGVGVESLKITPNGNLLYGYVNYDGASELGIIGRTAS